VDGVQLVDDDGLHGMVKRCGTTYLTNGAHSAYIAGFQAGGGVGMEFTYAGPDTAGKEVFVRAGRLPPLTILARSFHGVGTQILAASRRRQALRNRSLQVPSGDPAAHPSPTMPMLWGWESTRGRREVAAGG
jgi:hypothetical protein